MRFIFFVIALIAFSGEAVAPEGFPLGEASHLLS